MKNVGILEFVSIYFISTIYSTVIESPTIP